MKTIIVHSKLNNIEQGDAAWRRLIQTPRWCADRVAVYLKYTVPSLHRQTDTGFRIWLDCRPGSERDLASSLPQLQAAGVCVTFDRGKELIGNLPSCTAHVHLMRIDSDDMYGPRAVDRVRVMPDDANGLLFTGGVVIQIDGMGIRMWQQSHRSPPFYVQKMLRTGAALVAPFKFRSHGWFKQAYNPVISDGPHFAWLRHPSYDHHVWKPAIHGPLAKGKEITGDRRAEILDDLFAGTL
jgi:hypothetical protein